jgi:tetratricopeptide (TPR) repeat protein
MVPFGPEPPTIRISTPSKRKLSESNVEETDDITSFKRVRVISKKNRIKHVLGPFSSHTTTSGDSILNPQAKQQAEERAVRKLFEERATLHGLDHPDTLSSLNTLALCLRNQRKFAAAEDLFRAGLDARKYTLITEDPEALSVMMGNLMTVLVDQNKVLEADELWQMATTVFKSNLDVERAEALLQRLEVLYIFRNKQRAVPESPEKSTASHLPSNLWQAKTSGASFEYLPLAESLRTTLNRQDIEEDDDESEEESSEKDEAEAMHEPALAEFEKPLGLDHPPKLDTAKYLGILYREHGRLEEAEAMYQSALAEYEKALGPDDTLTLDTANDLGILYRDQGRLEEAEAMYQRALAGYEKALGPDHTSMLDTVCSLGPRAFSYPASARWYITSPSTSLPWFL